MYECDVQYRIYIEDNQCAAHHQMRIGLFDCHQPISFKLFVRPTTRSSSTTNLFFERHEENGWSSPLSWLLRALVASPSSLFIPRQYGAADNLSWGSFTAVADADPSSFSSSSSSSFFFTSSVTVAAILAWRNSLLADWLVGSDQVRNQMLASHCAVHQNTIIYRLRDASDSIFRTQKMLSIDSSNNNRACSILAKTMHLLTGFKVRTIIIMTDRHSIKVFKHSSNGWIHP